MAPDNFIKKPSGHWRWLLLAGLVLVALVLTVVLCLQKCSEPGSGGGCCLPDTGQATQDQPVTTLREEDPQRPAVPTLPSAEEPAETPGEAPTDPTVQPQTQKDPDPVPDTTPQPQEPEKKQLECEQIAVFSGAFVEDGSDEPVQNVASILVKNNSDQYLDFAQLYYLLDGEKAIFSVTGLPPGTSAWVMEASRKTATADSVFVYQDCNTTYRSEAVDSLEGLSVQTDGTMLKVTNNRDKTLKNLTLYYKVLHSDSNYFGGITYMVAFGDLEPGQSAQKLAGHFKEGWTDIVRVGYQEET